MQTRTLDLIRSLANERLIDIGDLARRDARFTPWESPLDASIDRLRKVYVAEFDANTWPWFCWINLTQEGDQLARRIEAGC